MKFAVIRWLGLLALASLLPAVAAAGGDTRAGSRPGGASTSPATESAVAGARLAAVRPQDDFYDAINARWLATTAIPYGSTRTGSFTDIHDRVEGELRRVLEDPGEAAPTGSGKAKIRDLYASFMDAQRIEAVGIDPLKPELARIDAVHDAAGVAALAAHLVRIGVDAPFTISVAPDERDASRYAIDFSQSGLGLPGRDYYLSTSSQAGDIRAKYRGHIENALRLAGDSGAAADATNVLALETEIARAQWTLASLRDPARTYHKVAIADLGRMAPGFDWKACLQEAGIGDSAQYVIVGQPDYLAAVARLVRDTPVETWKAYFRWQLLHAMSPYLGSAFADADFAFYGTVLRDVPGNRPRWKRGIALVDSAMGFELGRTFVADDMPPARLERIRRIASDVMGALRQSVVASDWATPNIRKTALAKLDSLALKVGNPASWRDYGALRVDRNDLAGNVLRARKFDYERGVALLGHPVDRAEWDMTPQTVNAYYNPQKNEVVVTAALLQPPFFQPDADDAVNYAGAGAILANLIVRSIDGQGAWFDGGGNLGDTWTRADHDAWDARIKPLVAQYSAFEPVPGHRIDGALTLSENAADVGGIAIAHAAYRLSLDGKTPAVVDGMTGDQRFFASYARAYREKDGDAYVVAKLRADPHAIAKFRVNGALMNLSAFVAAWGVKSGDGMYLAPDKRVIIW